MGKLTIKLSIAIGFATLLFSCILLYLTYTLSQNRVREVVEQQAALALKFNLAIRKYVENNVRPLMYELLGEEEFIPETMSTSFVARAIFEDVRTEFPDYLIKFSSDNPRNPANQAGKEELQLINHFNANQKLQRWQGPIVIDGKQYMGLFSARRMRPPCLHCHGDPADAPASMIEAYGATAGFHRTIGDVVGLDTVAIPMTRVSEILWHQTLGKLVIFSLGLLLFFLIITFTVKKLMINRLTTIAGHLRKAAEQTDYASIEHINITGRDEISDIASSYNILSDRLRNVYSSLESEVKDRTSELEAKNTQLRKEIEYRNSAQEAVKEREDRLNSIFRAAPTGIGLVSDRIFMQVNARLCAMVGYAENELLGQSSEILYPDREEFEWVGREKYTQIQRQGTGTVETSWKRKDGTLINVLLSSTPIDINDLSVGVTFTALDITGEKEAAKEKKYLEERLARSQKMEALGLLAGGVAHDLNNVLSGIVSYPDLLLADLAEDSPMRKPILTIQDSGVKAGAIVEDLLTLARRGVTNTAVLDLNKVLMEYIRSPEHRKIISHYPGIEIDTNLDQGLLNIRGSSVHLKKTIMNLIANAAEAMPSGGKINLLTESIYVDLPIKGYDEIKAGDFVLLTVSDSGFGIDKDDLKHIFEPFYTKKVMGRSGTGLGMSVVWGTVQDHEGYINVESTVGRGTRFQLYFPVTREEVGENQVQVHIDEYLGKGESILVVDDDKGQRTIASALLSKLGYLVETVSSGESAVQYLQQKTVDLVVLDMILGQGIDGLDTYRAILEFHPGQRAIIASGFSETARVSEAQRLGAAEYIKKPYTLERFGLAIKKGLRG